MEILRCNDLLSKYKIDITGLVEEFFEESLKEYESGIDMKTLHKSMEIYKDDSYLMIVEDKCVGLIAGMTIHSPLNNDKIYHEIMWYVKKEYRRKGVFLLRTVEKMLRDAGYTSIIMTCMHNSMEAKLFHLYRRLGYEPLQTHFRRSLWQK